MLVKISPVWILSFFRTLAPRRLVVGRILAIVLLGASTLLGAGSAPVDNPAQSAATAPTEEKAQAQLAPAVAKLIAERQPLIDSEENWLRLFREVYQMIRQNSITEKSSRDLVTAAIWGMITSLPHYNDFKTPDQLVQRYLDHPHEYGGIGVILAEKDGWPFIRAIYSETPAANAGLQKQDIIREIEGQSTQGLELNKISERLQGEPKSRINLTVGRRKNDQEFRFNLTLQREVIKPRYVYQEMLDRHVGYIRINSFAPTTAEQFEQGLSALEAGQAESLVFDLRNNWGGDLMEGIAICNRLLPSGQVIMTQESRMGGYLPNILAEGERKNSLPMIVLVNNGTASASEMVAAALKENQRAMLLGIAAQNKTFGKGSGQYLFALKTPYDLDEKGEFRYPELTLTNILFNSPQHHRIEGNGVIPDMLIAINPAEIDQINQIGLPGEDTYAIAAPPFVDTQLDYALKLLTAHSFFSHIPR
jgi:carboxyl-terminal processing protease